MPELPEVETITRALQELQGSAIENLYISPIVLRCQNYAPNNLPGLSIMRIYRRGKFIVWEIGPAVHMIFHLGMSGRLFLADPREEAGKHTHAIFNFKDGKQVRYCDPRRFGGIWLVKNPGEVLGTLGPEPLDPEFSLEYLQECLSGRRTPIKSLLLDQRLLAGLGNIYADEALFKAGISPERQAGSLNSREIRQLHRAVIKVLQDGITHGGTTFRDYRDGYNRPGGFQNHLYVYGRTGQPCLKCGKPVERIVIGGRSSHYCPRCQK